MLLGYPLVVLILKTRRVDRPMVVALGLGFLLAFQLLMVVLAPVVIMPLFNKFTSAPEGSLRQRLLALAARPPFPRATSRSWTEANVRATQTHSSPDSVASAKSSCSTPSSRS